MAAVTICHDFGAQEKEICHYFHLPFHLPWWNRGRCLDHSFFLVFSLKPVLSLSSFTLIKRLCSSSSSLSAIRVVSSAYLRLLMFLLPVLIPACNSSSPAFLLMCSVHRLNRVTADSLVVLLFQSWTNQLFHTGSYLMLLDLHTGFSGDSKTVWYSQLSKSFPRFVMIHTVKGFSMVDGTGCFSEIPLLSLKSSKCWQFDL